MANPAERYNREEEDEDDEEETLDETVRYTAHAHARWC